MMPYLYSNTPQTKAYKLKMVDIIFELCSFPMMTDRPSHGKHNLLKTIQHVKKEINTLKIYVLKYTLNDQRENNFWIGSYCNTKAKKINCVHTYTELEKFYNIDAHIFKKKTRTLKCYQKNN